MPEAGALGAQLPLWTLLPFAGMLLAIALLPLALPHFWERDRNRVLVSAGFALPVLIYLPPLHGGEGVHVLLEKGAEYVAFIALLTSLYVISGGIHVRGSLSGTPLLNTVLIGIGAL